MQNTIIEISNEDRLVADLNKDLLAIQKARHLSGGASLFRQHGELFTRAEPAIQDSLFEKK